MKLITQLQQWRLKNGKSVRATAKLVGLHYVTLGRILKGKNVPYDTTAYKISEFLKKQGK